MKEIEDELHVLVNCKAYDALRNNLGIRLDENNVWAMLESDSPEYTNMLCNFIYDLTEKRTTLMSNLDTV